MAVGSGLASQVGIAAETTYGTKVVVTNFIRTAKADLQPNNTNVQGTGIQSGVLGPLGAHYANATSAGVGTLEFDVQTKGMGLLMQALMGAAGTSVQQAATAAYLQTFALGDPAGKHITVQSGRPPRGGTVIPATLTSAKVTKADFSCAVRENLKASFELDSYGFDTSTALATASYVGTSIFPWALCAVKMGTFNSEAAVAGVRGMSVSIARPMDTEDYTANNAGRKAEPVINDFTDISGTVSADWIAKATFEDLAAGVTGTSLVWEFVGTTAIASTYYPTFRITVPGIYFEPKAQGVDGPKELTNDWNWSWKYDGTNLPSITYMTTDITVT